MLASKILDPSPLCPGFPNHYPRHASVLPPSLCLVLQSDWFSSGSGHCLGSYPPFTVFTASEAAGSAQQGHTAGSPESTCHWLFRVHLRYSYQRFPSLSQRPSSFVTVFTVSDGVPPERRGQPELARGAVFVLFRTFLLYNFSSTYIILMVFIIQQRFLTLLLHPSTSLCHSVSCG